MLQAGSSIVLFGLPFMASLGAQVYQGSHAFCKVLVKYTQKSCIFLIGSNGNLFLSYL